MNGHASTADPRVSTEHASTAAGLETNYRRGGFGGSIGFGTSPGLLVIDFVNAYFEEDSPLYAGDSVVEAADQAARVLRAFRQAGRPIVFTRVEYASDGRDGGIFVRKLPSLKALHPGSHAAQIIDVLQPEESEIVLAKQYPSAFFGTTVATMFRSWDVDSTVIVGLSTSGCIRASVVDSMQHGFIPVVVEDAVGDRHSSPHEANLFDMSAKYAEVLSTDEVLRRLEELPPIGPHSRYQPRR